MRIVTEYAWHSLFVHQLLIRPTAEELKGFDPEFTIIDLPSFNADPAKHGCASQTVIAVNFTKKMILIGGTSYAGEMKKSVFTILNYLLPPKRVMPMHCSANVGKDGKAAIFFGLSGTGKTTLSADAIAHPGGRRRAWLERAWRLQIEGGCYAKVIKLVARGRAGNLLHHRTLRHRAGKCGDGRRHPQLDLDDAKYAENTRAAYPIDFIPNASETGRAGHPKNVIMLTADAFGVLPPISRLTPSQAMYHFLSGFTAKVAGTEKGLGKEPQPTFSTCFGAPFMPRHPSEYGNLLRDLIAPHGADCWLVNTGWTGGAFGTGSRMPIKATRALLNAALDGSLANVEMRIDPHFKFRVPVAVPGVDTKILNPRDTWADKAAYDAQATQAGRRCSGTISRSSRPMSAPTCCRPRRSWPKRRNRRCLRSRTYQPRKPAAGVFLCNSIGYKLMLASMLQHVLQHEQVLCCTFCCSIKCSINLRSSGTPRPAAGGRLAQTRAAQITR